MAMIRPETEMKDSGVQWIGDIPSNWNFKPIYACLDEINQKNNPVVTTNILSLTNTDGVIPYSERGNQGNKSKENFEEYKVVYPNTIVANSMNILIGSVGLSKYEGCVSPVYYVYIAKPQVDIRYMNYLFQMEPFQKRLRQFANGILEIRLRVSSHDILHQKVAVPDYNEQQAIADYLDETCSKIDEMIAEAKSSIEEYKELKQSVIFEAVTKGLDKNVEMKEIDGWIRWLPKGWNFRKINGLFNVIGSGTTPKSSIEEYYQGTINWLQSGDINGTVVKNTKKHISDEIVENTSALVVYDAPFIAIAMYGASIGNISIVDINACTNQACCVLSQPTKDIDMGYSFWCIMSAKEELLLSSRGGGQSNISQNIIKQLRIPLPPLMEQRKIADYLSDKTKEIDSLIAEKESLINDLEAYKKSLIYEVVTGKRRVV